MKVDLHVCSLILSGVTQLNIVVQLDITTNRSVAGETTIWR